MIPNQMPKLGPPLKPHLHHIAWVCDDQDLIADFLTEHFGCNVHPPQVIDAPWASVLSHTPGVKTIVRQAAPPNSTTLISLLKYSHPKSLFNAREDQLNLEGTRHIGFTVVDIDEKTAELREAGYTFFSDPVYAPQFHVKTNYMHGPEGVVIQLMQHIPEEEHKREVARQHEDAC